MNKASLSDVLGSAVPSGVYLSRSRRRPAAFQDAIEERGWRFVLLDGRAIHDKATFLAAIARELEFPAFFGRNWDALNDSLNDLSWLPARGYVLLYDHAAPFASAHPGEWQTAQEILSDAARSWAAQGVPFYVLVRGIEE